MVLRRIVRIRRQLIFHIDDINNINPIDTLQGLVLSPITPENLDRIRDFRDERYRVKFRTLLDDGQVGIYALLDSVVVGHAWAFVCRKAKCRLNGYWDIRANEAAIHMCNVKPELRGNHVFPAMVAALCRNLLSDGGVDTVLIDTEQDNSASIKGIAKVGFGPPHGIGLYIQVLGRRLYSRVSICSPRPYTMV